MLALGLAPCFQGQASSLDAASAALQPASGGIAALHKQPIAWPLALQPHTRQRVEENLRVVQCLASVDSGLPRSTSSTVSSPDTYVAVS